MVSVYVGGCEDLRPDAIQEAASIIAEAERGERESEAAAWAVSSPGDGSLAGSDTPGTLPSPRTLCTLPEGGGLSFRSDWTPVLVCLFFCLSVSQSSFFPLHVAISG